MKIIHTRSALLALFSCIAFPAAADAAVVMTVDVTDFSAVTFTATGNFASDNNTLNSSLEGFTVEDFLTTMSMAIANGSGNVTGDLTSAQGGSGPYSGLGTFDYDANDGIFKAGNDLSIYTNGAADTGNQIFSTLGVAFTGTAVVDFTAVKDFLPTVGTIGNVISGYWKSGTVDHGEIVGQWQVVPEPSAAAMLALCGAGLLLRRKR